MAEQRKRWPSDHDPTKNATWEDWERWYDREYGRERRHDSAATMQFSNFGFLSIIVALVSLGGVMQGTRASVISDSVWERAERVNKESSLELQKSRRATMSGDRDERIETFVRHREAVHAGDDAYHRLLPPSDPCLADPFSKK